MPSDASKAALSALKQARETYLSAVASMGEELRGYLRTHASPGSDRSARLASELGPFAGGRVDPARFVAFLNEAEPLDPEALKVLDLAQAVLDDVAELEERSFFLDLQPGADLYLAVELGLAWLGRVFGAAMAAERAKQGHTGIDASILMDAFPHRRWTRGAREMAPPLVVELEGSDLLAGGLSAYLDGTQKLVLVVRGPTPPAPLVRLVSPGILVLQTDHPDDLKQVGGFQGPAVVALMPEGQGARFIHDPGLGETLADRLSVGELPAEDQVQALGRLTLDQQLEELRQLRALKEAVEGGGPARVAPADGKKGTGRKLEMVEPADALAGWLLSQANLSDT